LGAGIIYAMLRFGKIISAGEDKIPENYRYVFGESDLS